ncbi:MAG: V-type ATP synthase subunit I [Eubacteriales bacterium]|nr:V-type ATP synthase subunit I [Eubacteriales bacterium]
MIVSMKRITLVAHKGDEARLLKALQATQSVEVIQNNPDNPADTGLTSLETAQSRVQKLADAIATLRPYTEKASFFSVAPEYKVEELSEVLPQADLYSDRLAEISRELAQTKSEIDKNIALIESLRPWENFPADMLTFAAAKNVKYFAGMIAAQDVEKLENIEATAEYQLFNEGLIRSCVVACPAEEAKSVANFLKSLNWTDYAFPKLTGKPAEAMEELAELNRMLTAKKEELIGELSEQASARQKLFERAYDAAVIERDRVAASSELVTTNATFQLEGWIPEDKKEEVEKAIRSVTDAYYLDIRNPEDDEVPPSYVENKKFATPFEQVTNLYSRPDPKGIDATPYMAPFYVLLFGLMLSDTGYGIVLSILTALFIKLKKPTGMSGGFARVLFWGGISTIVWGVLVGTFFGMDFDTVFGTNNLFPLFVDPMENPIGMLILCFGLGVIHILFGVALKMKLSFSRGDWQTAVFDSLSWILIVVGLIVYAVPNAVSGIPAIVGTIGLYMAGLGAVLILLFKGRDKKNPFSRTISGLGELYQVTGYLSDILSYARLFALGIATGVIASVFNELCKMLMGSPILILKILGIAVACVLLVALHGFNIAINTLGAFVHCARLQYVEFYGKFYEMGGRAFRPLGYQTKHVRILDDASSTSHQ